MREFYISGRNVDGTWYLSRETESTGAMIESWTQDHFERGLWPEHEARVIAHRLETEHAKHRHPDGHHQYGIAAKEVPESFRRRTPEEQAVFEAELRAEEEAIEAQYPEGYFDDPGPGYDESDNPSNGWRAPD